MSQNISYRLHIRLDKAHLVHKRRRVDRAQHWSCQPSQWSSFCFCWLSP